MIRRVARGCLPDEGSLSERLCVVRSARTDESSINGIEVIIGDKEHRPRSVRAEYAARTCR
ncbi:hypothetical protein [Raoultibacter massiliensis]|uniref:Uncharacterized protein n=1 Tax=Raoultibacter massiliensis TaxID=1852371 RepID=A0ABV1JCZ4_9ACTN